MPKELGSSVVRIVHDGLYSADINHRIRVRDRMRFPTIAGGGGSAAASRRGGGEGQDSQYCTMWQGLISSCLSRNETGGWTPGGRRRWFRVLAQPWNLWNASAAYWWQRLAAGVARLAHALSGTEMGILHLLFADVREVEAAGGILGLWVCRRSIATSAPVLGTDLRLVSQASTGNLR